MSEESSVDVAELELVRDSFVKEDRDGIPHFVYYNDEKYYIILSICERLNMPFTAKSNCILVGIVDYEVNVLQPLGETGTDIAAVAPAENRPKPAAPAKPLAFDDTQDMEAIQRQVEAALDARQDDEQEFEFVEDDMAAEDEDGGFYSGQEVDEIIVESVVSAPQEETDVQDDPFNEVAEEMQAVDDDLDDGDEDGEDDPFLTEDDDDEGAVPPAVADAPEEDDFDSLFDDEDAADGDAVAHQGGLDAGNPDADADDKDFYFDDSDVSDDELEPVVPPAPRGEAGVDKRPPLVRKPGGEDLEGRLEKTKAQARRAEEVAVLSRNKSLDAREEALESREQAIAEREYSVAMAEEKIEAKRYDLDERLHKFKLYEDELSQLQKELEYKREYLRRQREEIAYLRSHIHEVLKADFHPG